MFIKFLTLEWKSFIRSASLGKSIALRIFLAFIAAYFIIMFIGFGSYLPDFINYYYPGSNTMEVANRFVLAWLLTDLLMRFFMQSLPVLNIKPLMVLPVSRKVQVHYVLVKSIFSFFNMLPLCALVPFMVAAVRNGTLGRQDALAWILGMAALTLAVNFANFLIKKKFAANIKALLPYVLAGLALAALDYFDVFKITLYSGHAFGFITAVPGLYLALFLIPAVLYYLNFNYLTRNFYLDASVKEKSTRAATAQYGWVRRFGDMAPFLQLDLKLIMRNKRPRATMLISFLFLFYGLIFLDKGSGSAQFTHLFIGIFVTGIFMINFGQFIPAWDSSYYPFIMAQNIPLRQYLASKAALLSFSVVVLALLSTPYVYFGTDVLLTILACAVYNIGINVPMLLYAGSFNKKRISLEKSPFMNYQGTGVTQWIIGIPLLLLPMGLWGILWSVLSYAAASAIIGLLGLAGIVMRGWLLDKIAGAYRGSKYAAISGFKEDEN